MEDVAEVGWARNLYAILNCMQALTDAQKDKNKQNLYYLLTYLHICYSTHTYPMTHQISKNAPFNWPDQYSSSSHLNATVLTQIAQQWV